MKKYALITLIIWNRNEKQTKKPGIKMGAIIQAIYQGQGKMTKIRGYQA